MSIVASPSSAFVRITRRRPLFYRRGPDPALDRPPHVRAASGLCWVAGRLVVVQDDANFLGFVSLDDAQVDDVPLPAGVDGRRVFDDGLDNKKHKPDLEVAFEDRGRLVALGSGGPKPARRGVVWWDGVSDPEWTPRVALFERLAEVAGHPLNLEGGVVLGADVLLAHRGGHRSGVNRAEDVLLTVDAEALRDVLAGRAAAPERVAGRAVQLGAIDGIGLHLTDLCLDGGRLWYAAAAEDTADYADDGRVAGAVIGRFDLAAATATQFRVLDERGDPSADKIEGIAPVPGSPGRLVAVTDPDDPDRPGELLDLEVPSER